MMAPLELPDSLVVVGLLLSGGMGEYVSDIIHSLGGDVLGQLSVGQGAYPYYTPEMGDGIGRVWVACRGPMVRMAHLKRWAMGEEDRWAINGNRRVNIDPGVLTEYSFILLTRKNYAHRIPIEMGIYGEVELIWKRGKWEILPWTYPDYQDPQFLDWVSLMRRRIKTLI